MNQNRLKFSLVTGDGVHHQTITEALSRIPINTSFYHFQDCETLISYLKVNSSAEYHIAMLDMDDPEHVGMDCLKAIRQNDDFNNIVIIAYSRVVDEEIVEKIFVEGGNIFFQYPKNKNEFSSLFRELLVINWKIYITGTNRQHFVLRL